MKFALSTSPFLHARQSTPWLMYQVILTLVPVMGAAFYFFGLSAVLQVLTACVACLLTEYVFNSGDRKRTLLDGSAMITGILLALTLPPGFPLWITFLGGIVAIGMGKAIWGGLGNNLFNPALLGRAFLQAAFPTAITTWTPPDGRYLGLRGTILAPPFYQCENVDAVTTVTPLSKMKFDHAATDLIQMLFGHTGGSLGETCGILLILAGIYLIIRKVINWRIPAAILLTVIVFSGICYLFDSTRYPSPAFMVLAGGMLLGTIYMATDLVTSPLTPKGCWIYGIGIGILVVLIRIWGGLPEGMMYAILLMNAATPLINRFAKVKTYGH